MEIARNIEDTGNYIYDYYKYSNLVNNMNENILLVKINLVNITGGFKEEYQNQINESNKEIIESIDEYNATEYEEEEEEIYIDNIDNAYAEYYEITNYAIDLYKNGAMLDNETIERLSELEDIMTYNLNSLRDYLDEWANNDKSMIDEIFNSSLVFYYILGLNCVFIITIILIFAFEINKCKLKG